MRGTRGNRRAHWKKDGGILAWTYEFFLVLLYEIGLLC